MNISAFGSLAAKETLQPFSYLAAPLGAHDVEIAISHCGICYSDIHLIDNDWNRSVYPFVPGHEIVGKITAVGSSVIDFSVGARVGVGWQRSSCMTCDYCRQGDENLCSSQQAICIGNHGGFADRIRTDGRFVFAIPEVISSAHAAPLLCGGATVFAPIRRFNINARSKVGVIGIGGLGHMALQFLNALDCEVTALSSSDSKREEALKMGAHHFVSSVSPRDLMKQADRFDLLLSTVHAKLDWIGLLKALRPNGALCLVGAPPGLIQFPPGLLLTAQRTICGSDIANRDTIVETLAFAARHGIKPQIETAPMSQVNLGLDRLRSNQVRYRMVLEN